MTPGSRESRFQATLVPLVVTMIEYPGKKQHRAERVDSSLQLQEDRGCYDREDMAMGREGMVVGAGCVLITSSSTQKKQERID